MLHSSGPSEFFLRCSLLPMPQLWSAHLALGVHIFTGPWLWLGNGGQLMANKRASPEDIISKLWQVKVLMEQSFNPKILISFCLFK